MIPENEMNLIDGDVAKLIAKKVCSPCTNKDDLAVQLFLEALVLPKDCNSYTDAEFERYILDFMCKF